MNAQQVQQLTRAVGTGFLATTDGQRPAVRPVSAYAWFDGQLWVATDDRTAKVADVRAHPRVEACFMDGPWRHARIDADAAVSDDPADKRRLYAAVPLMARVWDSPDDPHLVVLRLTCRRVRVMPEGQMHYDDVPWQ